MASWLEDVLTALQGGAAPAAFMPPASPFPTPAAPITADQEAAMAQDARDVAARRLAGQKRVPMMFGGIPDADSAGINLALGNSPAGTGVPGALGAPPIGPAELAPDGSVFGGVPDLSQFNMTTIGGAPQPDPVPPSVKTAKAMTYPAAEDPMTADRRPQAAPAATDVGAARRAAPAAAPMMPAAPAQKPFAERLADLGPGLIGIGSILAGEGSGAAERQGLMRQKRADEDLSRNMTAQWLLARGAPQAEVAAAVRSPEVLKSMITKYGETKQAQVVNGRLVRERPDGAVETLADYSRDEERKAPANFRWKDREKTVLEFIPGGAADPKYLREKGEKNAAPSGYRWIDPEDPDKGLLAIPGGPGEKVDAEVAARLGLAKSFLGQLPDIRRRVEGDELAGVTGAAASKLGIGKAGELRRQIDSGAEALLRMLTGAGMSVSEASNYVRRYQVDPLDSKATTLSKLGQLERELNSVGETVGKGRGGWNPPSAPRSGTIKMGDISIPWSVK